MPKITLIVAKFALEHLATWDYSRQRECSTTNTEQEWASITATHLRRHLGINHLGHT